MLRHWRRRWPAGRGGGKKPAGLGDDDANDGGWKTSLSYAETLVFQSPTKKTVFLFLLWIKSYAKFQRKHYIIRLTLSSLTI